MGSHDDRALIRDGFGGADFGPFARGGSSPRAQKRAFRGWVNVFSAVPRAQLERGRPPPLALHVLSKGGPSIR